MILFIFDKTKNAAYEIINTKGSTYYAIGLVVKDIIRAILMDQNKVYPVSTYIDGYYGVKDVCLSIPCVLSSKGIKEQIHLKLNKTEQKMLRNSASVLKKYLKTI